METQTSELVTAQWIEHIMRFLPTEVRSRRIMAKVVILLTSVRHMPNFEMLPLSILTELDMVSWPNRGMMFKLGEIIGCFGDFDEAGIGEIKAAMQKILDETAPVDSLKEHLAKEFNTACEDNHHISKPGAGFPLQLLSLSTTLVINIAALEDFSVTNTPVLSDGEIEKSIGAYFVSRGYQVRFCPGLIFADKDGQSLCTHYFNDTASRRRFLVTVKED